MIRLKIFTACLLFGWAVSFLISEVVKVFRADSAPTLSLLYIGLSATGLIFSVLAGITIVIRYELEHHKKR